MGTRTSLSVLAIAQVEDRENLDKQILKQTVQPNRSIFYVDKTPVPQHYERGYQEVVNLRKKRISENHFKLRDIVKAYPSDLIWQLEQDVILPPDCLEKLIKHFKSLKSQKIGYISASQVGRHGIQCIGAWNFKSPKEFESVDYRLKGLQKVDATGFYCLLAPRDIWLKGEASWSGEIWGPDVNFSMSLSSKRDYNIYIDLSLEIGHKVGDRELWPSDLRTQNVRFYQDGNNWKYDTRD